MANLLSNWSNVFVAIGAAFGLIGVVGIFAMGAAKEQFSSERIAANEAATERAKANAEEAKAGAADAAARVAEARAESASANARASEANARAAEAQLALAKLKAPRALSVPQQVHIAD